MPKIYCSVYNGLGNQLFSYALGLHISKRLNKSLIIDLTKLNLVNFLSRIGLKKDTIRKYELDKLGFIQPVKKFMLREFFKKNGKLILRNYVFADFRKSHIDLTDVQKDKHVYIIGWGDFNIVKDVLPEMRKKFAPNFDFSPSFLNTQKFITEHESIAIHIRRTDFLNNKISAYAFGICTDEFYNNAIQFITKNVKNPYYIIFSDDNEYVKKEFNIENSYIVEGNKGYEDFYLMSLCKHFILANSTFGFWAAMLNNEDDKLVCVPEYWCNNPRRMADFIPDKWEKISIT